MPVSKQVVQPGVILHEVIVGALRAKGSSFSSWCAANGVSRQTGRAATFGQTNGKVGRAIVEKMIDDAGRDWVMAAYTKRMVMEAARLKQVAA